MAYELLITTISDFPKQPKSASSTVASFSDEDAVSVAIKKLSVATSEHVSYRAVKLYYPSREFAKE